jgi:fructose-1,6-bisphosphatase/inositol monophosphatase family enzyme
MLSSADAGRVAELMRETAASELLPRFRALAKEDIRMKGPGDVVTVADEASEQRLASGLARIYCPACRWWARRRSRPSPGWSI